VRKIFLAIFALALLTAGAVFHRDVAAQAGFAAAPDFRLTDLKGKTISLADYKGKVLFLNFWATWCPPCRAEIPDFVEVYSEMKSQGLEILGVSLDTKGKDTVVAFVEKYKINYPVVLESKRATEKIISDFQPGQFIPTTIVIDKQGRIRDKYVGQLDKAQILKYFHQLSSE